METMVFTGIAIMLVVGVVVNIWNMIIRVLTPIFFLALGVIVFGFLFGGTEAFTTGGTAEWTGIMDILLGDGVGERVVGAVVKFVTDSIALFND